MTIEEMRMDEQLDASDPLRHLMKTDEEEEKIVIPVQRPKICEDQTLSFSDPSGLNTVTVSLLVDSSPGCGGIAWPAGEVLSAYLVARYADRLKDLQILELGSGTGLVGLVAGKLGANKIMITDQAPLLNIMSRNVLTNQLQNAVKVAQLNWGEPIPAEIPQPDLILAADCVYYEPAFPLLVQTLSDLVPNANTEVLFCYKKRRKADKRFFALLRKKFTWTDITDDPAKESYSREAISLLRLHPRAP